MAVSDQDGGPMKKRPVWAEVQQKAQELDAMGVPRTKIAEMVGMARITIQRRLGPKAGRAGEKSA